MRDITLNLRVIADIHQALLVINLGSFGLVVLDGSLLVAQDVANGFHDGAMFNQAGGTGGQQGGEQEEIARRDDDDIVVFGIEFFEQ